MDSNGVFKIEDIKAKPVSIKMDNGNPLITLTWENINVHTPGKQPRNLLIFKTKGVNSKHIVKNVSGIAKPGTLTVIMGASGSGKSTFLNALNFRHRGDLKVTGDVKINGGVVKSREALASLSGYVQQDDLFVGTLNVGEQLKFQAFLRMSKSTSKQEKLDRVEELLNDLNLKKCEHTTIGIPDKCVKGISGGEKRRLAFACELITNPNLLFFDEPTSGLDSFMAMTIVETMRHLTEKGKTIVCTMHQPSSELFSRFDRLLLMAEGRLAFLGDIHDSNNFFKSLGYDCPYNYNPADFIIKTLAIEPSNRQTSLDRINKICDGFEKSVFMKDLMVDVKNADNLATNPLTSVKLVNKMNYNVNYLVQFVWLLWRELLANSRNPFTIRIAISQTLIVSLLLGLIFLRVNYDQVGVQNINGVLFLILTNLSFTSMFAVINNFPSQIHIFMREHQNGMYSVISYYFSKILADLPRFIILPFVMVTIIYWMSNCNNNVARFFICVFIIIVSVNVAVSFGTFISALAPTPKIAISLNAPLLVPLMIFSGYFINSATIPVYFIWLKYLSWWSYAFELLVINQWQGVSGIECSNDTISNCYRNGNDVIHDLSFTRADYALNWIALFILFFGWKILAFVVLFLKSLKK